MRVRVNLAVICLATAAVLVSGTAVRAATDVEVVVSGLNNPRQLALDHDGALLVAEAGRGAVDPSGCVGELCVGATGSITRIARPAEVSGAEPRRVVTGLLSMAEPTGWAAVGSNGVSGAKDGSVYVVVTGVPTGTAPGLPDWQSGKLLRADARGRVAPVADIGGFEIANDPDGEGVDSNPYAVLALHGRQLVADAAGDSLVEVRGGRTRLFAVLPDPGPGVDPVPTSLAVGRDGRIYVGELHSQLPGQARVHVYSSRGKLLESIGGFSTVHGLALDRRGNLYVSELQGGPNCSDWQPMACGQVTKVSPTGARTSVAVPLPGGIVVDGGGRVFVAAWSITPVTGTGLSGQVVRVRF